MRSMFRVIIVALVFFGASGAHAVQSAYSGIFAFGDSLIDNGNVFLFQGGATEATPYQNSVPGMAYAPVNPSPFGNFSNGPVWVDYLAASMNLPLLPSFSGPTGTNFAVGGAMTGSLDFGGGTFLTGLAGFNILPVAQSVAANGPLPMDALYIVGGGGNDIRNTVKLVDGDFAGFGLSATEQEAKDTIGQGAGNLADAIAALAAVGAKNFLVPNLPNVGRTPDLMGTSLSGAANPRVLATELAQIFNVSLTDEISDLRTQNPSINIITVDIFSLTEFVLDNPNGLNVTNACTLQNAGNGCADPSNYLFWDGIHPTTTTHAATAAAALEALNLAPVPVPAAIWLFVGAAGVLARSSMRRG